MLILTRGQVSDGCGTPAMTGSEGVLSRIDHARRRCGHAAATAVGRSRCRKRRCGWPGPRWRTATPLCQSPVANSEINHVTLYRYVGPQGELREQGEKSRAT